MAEDRVLTSYYFDPKKADEIHVKKTTGETVISDKLAAIYDAEAQKLTFDNLSAQRLYKLGVLTFLAEQEMLVKIFERKDLGPDEPLKKNVPPRPKKNKKEGDKTPEVVEWYQRYRPKEFKVRYGILGTYSGLVRYLEPIWAPRPVDGILEFRGEGKVEMDMKNITVATRALADKQGNRITYTPDECEDWDEDEPEEFRDAEEGSEEDET